MILMHRPERFRLHFGTLLVFLSMLVPATVLAQRPNIIYIMTDDMGYGDLSCYGRKDFTTPNIDKLASQGVRFVNAYAAAPLCTPTRAGFITGRYPAKTPVGLIEPLTGGEKDINVGLTPDVPSLAATLKAGGYETAMIGKWHLGELPQHSPVKNGFDYFYGVLGGAADYISHKGSNHQPDLYENDSPVNKEGYLTELLAQRAATYIGQQHSKPFFLAVTFTAPHWPWQAPGDLPYPDSVDFRAGGSPATYQVMMKNLDDAVGLLMKAVDDAGMASNTMVIFTNDNGGERYSNNGGLSNAKGTLWEGGIRVPAFVRWPGRITPGTTTPQVAITMDWTATILSAAGVKASRRMTMDGIDLMPYLGGKKVVTRTLYWRTFQRTQHNAIRMGDWKYLKDAKGEYLFNLANDEQEKTDLSKQNPDVFNKLKKLYTAWEKTVLTPVAL